METIGGKVWHMFRPTNGRPSDIEDWYARANRRASSGYIVTPQVFGHPLETVCPHCKIRVVNTKPPGG